MSGGATTGTPREGGELARHRGRVVRGRWRHLVAVAALVALTAVIVLLWMRPQPREFSPDLVPRPAAPFGSVPRSELRFHWLLPTDEAPVIVEVLDADRQVVWRSPPSRTGVAVPTNQAAGTLPEGDLYWRPVAAPEGEAPRPGELAAFALRGP